VEINVSIIKVPSKILFLLAGLGLCGAALAASPVVVSTYPPAKGAKMPQYSVDADTQRLDGRQLGIALSTVAKDKARGATTPVAVLLDPALTLADVDTLARSVTQSGMNNVRYFVYQGDRSMVAEMAPHTASAFPRSRLESEIMAAPK
jgi:hypothetical protein